ncbi:MAG: energy transducer TonB [Bacteroidales bacterium]|jgi:protein TonB|nr:energy transducer TonB [Bacteroidales bacterium]
MKNICLFFILFLSINISFSQENNTNSENHEYVEVKPTFPGGDEGIVKYLKENIKYPKEAREIGIEGKVIISFLIDTSGKVTETKVIGGVNSYLDAEALRVVSNMPDWTPGIQRGKAVPVTYVIPINFTLTKGKKRKNK